MKGRQKTLTWLGCILSTLMVVAIALLLALYLRDHFAKKSSKINSYLGTSSQNEGYQFFDLHSSE